MPPKKRATPPPIDRPLSKAYLRQFKGWSTAYPPGQSDPSSLRVLENCRMERNGALSVRPGLRYLSYLDGPYVDPIDLDVPGSALANSVIGGQELFYLEDGSRALLFAVREDDGTVGFRVQLFHLAAQTVFQLTDPEVAFMVPQGLAQIAFTANTTFVKYLQINNRILALSDAGEPARLFYVGAGKWAKKLSEISVPEWEDEDKLTAFHPKKDWILAKASSVQYNRVKNPTFEAGTDFWSFSENTAFEIREDVGPGKFLVLTSKPPRTNLATSPLTDVPTHGIVGWAADPVWSAVTLAADTDYLKVTSTALGRFYATGTRYTGVVPGERYTVAVDAVKTGTAAADMLVDFQGVDGVSVEAPLRIALDTVGRTVSLAIQAPPAAVTMRLSFGGTAATIGDSVSVKDVVVCLEDEASASFNGDSGVDFFWTGTVNESASVYHPDVAVETWTNRSPCTPANALSAGAEARTKTGATVPCTVTVRMYTKDGTVSSESTVGTASDVWTVKQENVASVPANSVTAELVFTSLLGRGEELWLNESMIVPDAATLPTYYDGNSTDTSTIRYGWSDPLKPHQSASVKSTYAVAPPALLAETKSANTLISSDATKNTYKLAFFYTFENEVGESTPSKLTEIRMMRAWSDWRWEEPGTDGPDTTLPTQVAERCADQIVAQLPQDVYDQAIEEGALGWNLYALTWSDQEPVPVTGLLVNSRPLRQSLDTAGSAALPYADGSWLAVTPNRRVTSEELPLPSRTNRVNYSTPPRHRSGLVAADRMILVGDPNDLASIQWTSNLPAESTNFTPSKGGGRKTLTSGNLNIPADVVLWQNPQSIDTITILCIGDDGRSVAYYMSPATVNQGQSGMVSGMSFEQVSSTPGSTGSYCAEVINNALFRPVDHALLKSTANNYNINHKTQSDMVSNMWQLLRGKSAIVTAQLDNRLYLLVHNPLGDQLEPGCKGNEIWVYDVQAETGTWSRYLIQASALSVFSVRNRAYVGVSTPDGLFYLDEEAREDDYVSAGQVLQRPIPWYFETNTQGASRAHDAWAHLQGLLVTVGNFSGSMRYGVRGHTINGKPHEVEKTFTYVRPLDEFIPQWDVEDQLLVRRDFKEWVFFAGSIDGQPSWGQLSAVQYRYTPVSVNVGYEFGSVETFEYGAGTVDGYSENGIPLPYMDYSQP